MNETYEYVMITCNRYNVMLDLKVRQHFIDSVSAFLFEVIVIVLKVKLSLIFAQKLSF